ncbi:MAG: DUF2135 domain-containing protein [Zoogloeaceae bacterium]|jgi:uncharacterized protein YfaP (DUF2135 family)|nr:DUF2135 domain-containing protein [Zoogloeaceae bacterium]
MKMNANSNASNTDTLRHRAARLLPGLAFALMSLPAAAELDLPISGWRPGDPDTPFTQAVEYPAVRPSISANTPGSALIQGRIRAHEKQANPATLIVNGNAMPMRLDESGAFARPYSFGAGSNSVEVISGNERSRVQFYQSANGQPVSRLRVMLSWDTNGTDLDLHVITPSGQHAWYGQRAINGGAIDIDVTDGYGPEIFASPAPEKGLYQIYINFYGGRGDGYDEDHKVANALTIARLTITTNENTPHEKRQEFTVPMRFSGELILVRQFMYP